MLDGVIRLEVKLFLLIVVTSVILEKNLLVLQLKSFLGISPWPCKLGNGVLVWPLEVFLF